MHEMPMWILMAVGAVLAYRLGKVIAFAVLLALMVVLLYQDVAWGHDFINSVIGWVQRRGTEAS